METVGNQGTEAGGMVLAAGESSKTVFRLNCFASAAGGTAAGTVRPRLFVSNGCITHAASLRRALLRSHAHRRPCLLPSSRVSRRSRSRGTHTPRRASCASIGSHPPPSRAWLPAAQRRWRRKVPPDWRVRARRAKLSWRKRGDVSLEGNGFPRRWRCRWWRRRHPRWLPAWWRLRRCPRGIRLSLRSTSPTAPRPSRHALATPPLPHADCCSDGRPPQLRKFAGQSILLSHARYRRLLLTPRARVLTQELSVSVSDAAGFVFSGERSASLWVRIARWLFGAQFLLALQFLPASAAEQPFSFSQALPHASARVGFRVVAHASGVQPLPDVQLTARRVDAARLVLLGPQRAVSVTPAAAAHAATSALVVIGGAA